MKLQLFVLCLTGAVVTSYSKAGPTPIDLKAGPTPIDLKAGPTPIDLKAGPTPIDLKAGPTPIDFKAGPTPIDFKAFPTGVIPKDTLIDLKAGPTPIDFKAGPTPIDFKAGPTPIDFKAGPTPIDLKAGPTPIDFKAGPTPIDLKAFPTGVIPKETDDHQSKLRCAQFREMEMEDRFRREIGKERVFAKYCSASPNSVIDNYCQCAVVPRAFEQSEAILEKSAARSFLSIGAHTRALNEECCNEGCNLQEIVELSKAVCP